MANMWYMSPSDTNIQVIQRDPNKTMKSYTHSVRTECLTFSKDNKAMYAIFMDDEGSYKNLPVNDCASKLLLKIKTINWGVYHLTGWYTVAKYEYDDDGNETQVDMDVTPKEFLSFCRKCNK